MLASKSDYEFCPADAPPKVDFGVVPLLFVDSGLIQQVGANRAFHPPKELPERWNTFNFVVFLVSTLHRLLRRRLSLRRRESSVPWWSGRRVPARLEWLASAGHVICHASERGFLDSGVIISEAQPLDSKPASLWVKVPIALIILALYTFSQPWALRGFVSDVRAATLPAWQFVETGSFDLTDYRDEVPEHIVETPGGGFWTNRSPGVVGFAVVAYAVSKPFTDDFQNWPGTAMAVLTSWLAVIFVAASTERLRPGMWVPAAVLFGLGTATWGPAANQLNSHGPAQLAVAIAIWLFVKRKDLPAGLYMALGVLVRPPVVILGFGLAVIRAYWDRSLKPLLTIGLPTATAAIAYLVFGRLIFGSWSPSAAYEAVGGFWGVDSWLANTLTAFVSPLHGVLVWSAWIPVAAVLMWPYQKLITRPEWLFPVVAGLYIVVHSALEIASGALPYNYRYPLEAVTFASPFLIATLPEGMSFRIGRATIAIAGAIALILQGLWTLTSRCGVFAEHPTVVVCNLFGS